MGNNAGHTPSKPARVARNEWTQELHLHTVKGAHGIGVGVHLDLSYMTLSTATLVSQFLETQLRNQSVKLKKKNLSLISFEMQTEMFDRAWLRYVGIQQPASKAALLLNATLGRRGGRNLVTPL